MNICRPIILHNEFLPASTGERTWDYRTFGHYDGITVKESICIERYEKLKPLFDKCLKYEEDCFMYSSQTLLGFHTKTEKEEQFWREELPFLYIVLLQVADIRIEEYQKYLESRKFLEEELFRLGRQSEIENTFITAYYSLDNSDLIVVIKCGHANTGAALINSLHQVDESERKIPILNSHSILGICQKEIKKPGPLIEANEPIDEIELRVIERDNDSIGALYRRLKNELEISKNEIEICVKTLLGTGDEAIIIRNLPWKLLLPLYREKTGILNNSSERAQKYAYAISAKIMLPFDERKMKDEEELKETEKTGGNFCIWLNKRIDAIYSEKNDTGRLAEKKNLMMFAKSLFRFENAYYIGKGFSDYNFFSLYLPFYTFVKLLGKKDSSCPEDYYDFMERLRLRTQGFAKPDRVFSQVTDFNMRFFDVPIKFITLYSAYIYYFKRALNTKEGKNYEFLVCPGMNSQIGVMELFVMMLNDNRLFFLEIPEQQMYTLKQTFIIIGHEIAHFVGTDVRCRSERKAHMVNLCSRIIVLSMKNYLGYMEEFVRENMDDLGFDDLELKLRGWLDFYIDREKDKKYLRKYKYDPSITDDMVEKDYEQKDRYGEHSDVLRTTLISSVDEMLSEHGQEIFGYIFHKEFYERDAEIGYEGREAFLEEKMGVLQECIHAFTINLDSKNHALKIGNVIDEAIYLLKECYADMICILTLHLSLKDYLETLTEIIDGSNKTIEELTDTILPARIAIVMTVIGHSLEKEPGSGELLFRWTEEEFDYEADEEASIRKLEMAGNMFAGNYIVREGRVFPDDEIGKPIEIIYDHKILIEIIIYLLECRRKYFKILTGNEEDDIKKKDIKKKEIQYVQDIYSLSKIRESGEFFEKLMDMISHYETDVYAEMQKIICSEK